MRPQTRPKRPQGGFTLIEILVVVLIVGLLVSTVGVNVYRALFSGQRGTAETQIKNFHQALDQYKLEFGKFPEELEELLEPGPTGEPIMQRIPLDPWNNEYYYELTPDNKPNITCYGEDGEPGGDGKAEDFSSETLGLIGGR